MHTKLYLITNRTNQFLNHFRNNPKIPKLNIHLLETFVYRLKKLRNQN